MRQISEQKAKQLSIYNANCLNNISPLAQCHICAEVCPQQALTWQNGRWNIQNCNLCGICTTVCPTQVFQIDQRQLLYTKKDHTIQLCCYQNTLAPAEALHLNCLQQLSPLMILHLLYQYSAVTIYLTPEKCQQCVYCWYPEGLLQQLEQYQIPQDKLRIILQTADSAATASAGESRRNFLADFLHRSETNSKKALLHTVESIATNFTSNGETTEPAIFPTRLPLYALYIKKQLRLQPQQTLPFRLMSCISCTFCGACNHICPTDALEIVETGAQKELRYQPELCINCNLCQKICMQHGLQWEDFMTQQQFLQTPQILAQSSEKICTDCAESYYQWPLTESTICPLCETFSDIE